jgi:YVTN family beta-propeller protein
MINEGIKYQSIPALSAAGIFFILFAIGCRYDKLEPGPDSNGYPAAVRKIIITKCAVTGCHDDFSYDAAGGLNISTWEKLFEGSRNKNMPVIPYSTELSFLVPFVNTFPDLGTQLLPTMPVGKTPLSREEVITLRDWIAGGAPDANGYVKFSDNHDRRKIYVANQGCDLVSVFDAETKSLMRYVSVGKYSSVEVPHSITVSPDGKFWYVNFINNTYIEKYRCSDDVKVGEIDLGIPGWHTMAISGDSKFALAVHWDVNGAVARIDLTTFQLLQLYSGTGMFYLPHGCVLNQNGTIGYVTAQSGNFIYKLDMTDADNPNITMQVLNPGDIPNPSNNQFNPHQVRFSPDYFRYFVTAEAADELRVFSSQNDSLLAVIPTCQDPEEMAFSATTPYLFVSSYEDAAAFAPNVGCISVINYQTNSFVKNIYPGCQPHQLVVDDLNGYVFVANRNVSLSGPAPHHTSACLGKNGYATAIDLSTLNLVPNFKVELSVDPYSVAIRK